MSTSLDDNQMADGVSNQRTTATARDRAWPTSANSELLLAAAAQGDQLAWNELVDRYSGMVTATVRRFRLSDSDVTDIAQTAWLRLVQNIDRIDDPSRVGAWLVTTARREAIRVLAQRRRVVVTCSDTVLDQPDQHIDLTAGMVEEERQRVVSVLLNELSPRHRQLLMLLMSEPQPSYDDISRAMKIPVGSIGPTRGRALRQLGVIAQQRGLDVGLLL